MIRAGTERDYARCVELGFNFHQIAYGAKGVPYCTDSCLVTLKTAHDMGLFVVAEFDGTVQGFCMGFKGPMMMNHSVTVGCELAWWLEPEYRGGMAGIGMLKAIEKAAKAEGVDIWSMVLIEGVSPAEVQDIYFRMGYKPAESAFIKRL